MGYALPARIRLDVDPEFGPGLWVEIKNPRLLTWSESKAIEAARRQAVQDSSAAAVVAEKILETMVTDWNLPSLTGAGIAPLPSKDPSLDQVPADAVVPLVLRAMQPKKAEDPNSSSGSASTSAADPSAGT